MRALTMRQQFPALVAFLIVAVLSPLPLTCAYPIVTDVDQSFSKVSSFIMVPLGEDGRGDV